MTHPEHLPDLGVELAVRPRAAATSDDGAPPSRRPLVLLEAATLLSGTGNGVATVALPWLILERTGSPAAAGLVGAATAVPMLASALLSGTLVDILGRRRVSIASDVLSLLAVLAIPLLDATLGLTVAALAVLAALGAAFDPAGVTARETMLPAVAARARWPLERVNGAHEAVWGVAFLVGPGVGGVLIAAVGAVGALWVTAGGFALSILCVAVLRVPGAGRPPAHERPEGVWRATREGLVRVWRDRLLRTMALLSMAVVALYLPMEGVVLPVHFEREGTPERFGVLIMAMSAGGIAGALGYGALATRVRPRIAFGAGLLATALAIAAMAPLPPFGVLVALGFVVGVAYGPIQPIVNLAMQRRTPPRLLGRVTGILTASAYAAGPVGYLPAGPLVSGLGVRGAFAVLAGLLLVVAVVALLAPALRELDRLR